MSTNLDRNRVNHELKKLGLGGFEDPNLLAQIAFFIRSHDQFRGLLMAVTADKRKVAYEALRSHLRFTPKPLDVYEMELKQKAEREQWDVFDGSPYPKLFKVPEISLDRLAQDAIAQNFHEKHGGLSLTCAKCTTVEIFRANDRKQAEKESHRAGWRSDGEKNWCPKCVPGRCTMTIACCVCEKEEKIRAWDPQDGYAAARLQGWVIEDAATCSACAVKKLVLQ
jgi:hypothetical protein